MKWDVYNKSGSKRYEIHKIEYNGEYMGKRSISVSIKSPVPVDFKIGDHFTYRGEEFTLKYIPSVKKKETKNKSGDAFVYDNIIFSSYGDELALCDFLDYVLNDNQIHFSSLPTFGFYAASIQDLADRIKANLDRVYIGSDKWTVIVQPENVEVSNVFISADKLTVWGALALVSSVFKSNFIIRGRTITIGTAGSVIDNVFKHGKGNGLNEITQSSESDQKIITRLRVYGSTRNLPSRYYNKLTRPDSSLYLPDNMAVQTLMLPSFPYETTDPYLDSPNIGELGAMEGSVFFDGSDESLPEIYPSLEGMTAQQLIDAGIPVSLDSGDNGNLDEIASGSTNEDGSPTTDNGIFEDEDVPPFKITLKDIGFDINDHLSPETAVISMKSGMCGGREFEILSCEKVGNKYVLTCNRVLDDGIGRYFPYSDFKINSGDKFVLLNIEMPEVYIKAAAQRLLTAGQEYLSKNDYVRYTYGLKVSPVYMARNPQFHDSIIEGDYLMFSDEDLNIDGSVIIDTLTIKEGEDIIPKYEVTLSEEKQVGKIEKIQNQINLILSGQGIGINTQQVESLINLVGNKRFLSKLSPDTAKEIITFLKGIIAGGTSEFAEMIVSGKITAKDIDVNDNLKTSILQVLVSATLQDAILKGQLNSETFTSGFLGEGFRLSKINGRWTLELDDLIIRKTMQVYELIVQRARYQGGQVLHSPAGGKITSVTNGGTYWRIEHDSPDSFTTGAQVLCQNFKVGSEQQNPDGSTSFQGVSVKRYWRLVTSYGKGWFNLSKTDMEAGSAEPEVGDEIAVLGHRSDPAQQNAIMIVSAGNNSPYIAHYAGINSYSTTGKEVVREGNLEGIVDSVFGQLSGYGLYGQNVFLRGRFSIQSGSTTVLVPADKGSWSAGTYYYYDRVSHNGSLWLCVAQPSTTSEPSDGSPYWEKQVDKGTDGKGISDTQVRYQVGSSGTTVPTGTWLSSVPSLSAGQFLWTRTITTYTDSTSTTSYSVSMYGQTGTSGKGIGSTVITYQAGASGTTIPTETWTSSIPSVAENQFLWTRTVITYTDSTTSTSYSVGKMGAKGDTGEELSSGKMLYKDPTFKSGNNGTNLYNNGSGVTTYTRITKPTEAPSDSTHIMRFTYTSGSPAPGFGGFSFGNLSRVNAVFVTKIIAKIPVGKQIAFGSNSYGDVETRKQEWLTPVAGTGKYETYLCKVTCGVSGTFSSTNFFYFTGGSGSFDVDIAFATIYDTTLYDDTYDKKIVEYDAKFVVTDQGISANASAITSVQNNVTGLTTRVSAAESQLTIQAGQIATKVSQTSYDANNVAISTQFTQINQKANGIEFKVDNIKIGGRNLLASSNDFSSSLWYNHDGTISTRTTNQSVAEWGATDATRIQTTAGNSVIKIYRPLGDPPSSDPVRTVSFWVKNNSATNLILMFNSASSSSLGQPYTIAPGFSGRLVAVVTYAPPNSFQLQFRGTTASDSLDFTIWRVQVETGNKVTDWSEAQEDLPAKLASTGINIENKIITLQADKTVFKSNAGATIAVFNSAGTKIVADAIALEGLTTINSKFKVLLDGSIEAVDGKFSGQITAPIGKIGEWNIVSGKLTAAYGSGAGISISESGGRFLEIQTSSDSSAVMSIRNDGGMALRLYTQAVAGLALSINAQTGGTAIRSAGGHYFMQRSGEKWTAPGVLGSGMFTWTSTVITAEKTWSVEGVSFYTSNRSGNNFRLVHNLGHTDYVCFPNAIGSNAHIRVLNRTTSYVEFEVISFGSDQQFFLLLVGRNVVVT